jgi:hypothetical protein
VILKHKEGYLRAAGTTRIDRCLKQITIFTEKLDGSVNEAKGRCIGNVTGFQFVWQSST